MKLLNLRLGFATNSSSTHSIVFLPKGLRPDTTEDNEFGWEHFTAACATSKMNWLAYSLVHSLQNLPKEYQYALANAVLGSQLSTSNEGYVDHQSMYEMPYALQSEPYAYPKTPQLATRFIEQLRLFLSREDVAILGGNDNEDAEHPLLGSQGEDGTPVRRVTLRLPDDVRHVPGALLCREESPGVWTFFYRTAGTRWTIDFNAMEDDGDNKVSSPYRDKDGYLGKLRSPLLVDLKITDHCPFGCAYCYQGSTAKGAHALVKNVRGIRDALLRAEVFEVAIGGGEPTLHPEFTDILQLFQEVGITVNFSTRNAAYFTEERLKEVLPLIGSFAASVDSADDVLSWVQVKRRIDDLVHYSEVPRINLQIVAGAMPWEDLLKILETAKKHGFYRTTLLGWKTTGRGNLVQPHVYPDGWLKVLHDPANHYYSFGVDTTLARTEQKTLDELGVPRLLYTLEEGKQSMYIDAVTMRVGPSSYCDEEAFTDVPERLHNYNLHEVFKKY